jgi:hypothetical protein
MIAPTIYRLQMLSYLSRMVGRPSRSPCDYSIFLPGWSSNILTRFFYALFPPLQPLKLLSQEITQPI